MKILVVSYSTHPEPLQMAGALTRAGHEVQVVTAASFGRDAWIMKAARAAGRRGILGGVTREILRRELPDGLSDRQIIRGGHLNELQNLLHRKLRGDLESAGAAMLRRNDQLGERLRGQLRRRRSPMADVDMIVAQQGSAFPVFTEVGPSAVRVLNYPIAHHRWLAREITRELALRPDRAGAIYLSDRPDEEALATLDAEIDAADHLIVGSTFVKRTCVEYGVDPERISVLPLASVSPEFTEADHVHHFPDGEALRVVFAGQVTQRKGIYYLLDALDMLPEGMAHLVVIGEGPREIMADIRTRSDVTVLGSMPRSRLMALVSEADVSALPSLGEGFPLTQIEAMSVGTPVIVSTATFGHDVVTEGVDGFVVEPRDTEAIAQHLRALAEDRGLARRMGEAAAVTARGFTWDRYRERVVPLVEGVARGHSVTSPGSPARS